MLNVTAFVICICNSIAIATLLYLYHISTKNKYWIYIKNIGYFRYFRKYHDIFHLWTLVNLLRCRLNGPWSVDALSLIMQWCARSCGCVASGLSFRCLENQIAPALHDCHKVASFPA